jgi:hypothetical protein
MARERPIVDECLARLRALETVRTVEFRPGPDDGLLVLTTDSGRFQYFCEVKRSLNRPRLEHALVSTAHPPKAGTRRLLLTDFLPGPLIDVLEQAQVDFVDAAGNMLLRWPGKLYVHVKGMKPARVPEATGSFLTTPNGLRVLFSLLAEPGADVPAYRELSERAAVSLGTVGRVALELQRRGFLVIQRPRKRRVLHRKRELLELWVGGYAERLRPQLVIGRFRSPDRDPADALKRLTAEADGSLRWALTGGFAADVLTGHYRGDQLVLFVDPWSSTRAAALRWLPSVDGPITALRMFWPERVERTLEKGGARVAHPLLVYAELLFQGREREVETAKLVYEKYLQPNISDA